MEKVSHPAAEREPDHVTPAGWTTTPGGYQVPADLDDDPRLWTGEPIAAGAAESLELARETFDAQVQAMAEPERRTVSLEVLTDELFAEETDRRREEMGGGRFDRLPTDSRVAVVLRTNGELACIIASDDPEGDGPPPVALYRLLRVAYDAAQSVMDPDLGGELLMPEPSVLAALAGTPGAGAWTAPVPVIARHVQPGWLVVGYSGDDTEERIEAKADDCGDPLCPWPGDCTPLTIGGDGPQHFADWTSLTVRIPAAVTR